MNARELEIFTQNEGLEETTYIVTSDSIICKWEYYSNKRTYTVCEGFNRPNLYIDGKRLHYEPVFADRRFKRVLIPSMEVFQLHSILAAQHGKNPLTQRDGIDARHKINVLIGKVKVEIGDIPILLNFVRQLVNQSCVFLSASLHVDPQSIAELNDLLLPFYRSDRKRGLLSNLYMHTQRGQSVIHIRNWLGAEWAGQEVYYSPSYTTQQVSYFATVDGEAQNVFSIDFLQQRSEHTMHIYGHVQQVGEADMHEIMQKVETQGVIMWLRTDRYVKDLHREYRRFLSPEQINFWPRLQALADPRVRGLRSSLMLEGIHWPEESWGLNTLEPYEIRRKRLVHLVKVVQGIRDYLDAHNRFLSRELVRLIAKFKF